MDEQEEKENIRIRCSAQGKQKAKYTYGSWSVSSIIHLRKHHAQRELPAKYFFSFLSHDSITLYIALEFPFKSRCTPARLSPSYHCQWQGGQYPSYQLKPVTLLESGKIKVTRINHRFTNTRRLQSFHGRMGRCQMAASL